MGEEKIENKTYMIDKETGKKVELAGSVKPLINNISNNTGLNIGIDLGGSVDMTFIDKEAIKMKQAKSKRLKKKYYKRTFYYQMLNGGK